MATQTDSLQKVSTSFVYRNLGHVTENKVASPSSVTSLSVATRSPITYNVPDRVLDIGDQSITKEHLQRNLDMSDYGFNAAMVDGHSVDNRTTDGNALWTASRILDQIRVALANYTVDAQGLRYVFTASEPDTEFVINHNLGSFVVDYTLLVKYDDGSWHNDIGSVVYKTINTAVITLSEPAIILAIFHLLDQVE